MYHLAQNVPCFKLVSFLKALLESLFTSFQYMQSFLIDLLICTKDVWSGYTIKTFTLKWLKTFLQVSWITWLQIRHLLIFLKTCVHTFSHVLWFSLVILIWLAARYQVNIISSELHFTQLIVKEVNQIDHFVVIFLSKIDTLAPLWSILLLLSLTSCQLVWSTFPWLHFFNSICRWYQETLHWLIQFRLVDV